MKVSLKWLQTYFEAPLPSGEEVADAFTFHSFEVEEQDGDLIDLKVLPDRSGYALSHRGVASELSAALRVPMKADPLRTPLSDFPKTNELSVEIEDSQKCLRYMGALVKGVKVGPSPDWLKAALESVGQKSINNVVDATNYVMLNVGQPLHAFDADKLQEKDGSFAIRVRNAKAEEKITTLTNDEYELPDSVLLITDGNAGAAIGIAGIKGGKAGEVTSETKNLIIESANFDGTSVRRAAQKLKLFTDASLRFQNRPSPELVAYGMRDVLKLITDIAGGEVVGVVDEYPAPASPASVTVSLGQINSVLGSEFSHDEVSDVFNRLGLPFTSEGMIFTVTPPFERTDLVIAEDFAEEVGRLIGYEHIPPTGLPMSGAEPDQARWRGAERMKDQLVEEGFIEISTQSFAKKGDVLLANPLDKKMPTLRISLEANLTEALTKAKHYAPLTLLPGQKPKLFEIGTVFPKEGEHVELRMTETVPAWGENFPTVDNLSVAKLADYGKGYAPKRYELGLFKPFSSYPFVLRDISFWLPENAALLEIEPEIVSVFKSSQTSDVSIFHVWMDKFTKDGKTSAAYRLVFQSMERTLTDEEVNTIMEKVYAALKEKGYEIR